MHYDTLCALCSDINLFVLENGKFESKICNIAKMNAYFSFKSFGNHD